MAKKNTDAEKELDPKIAAQLGGIDDFSADALENEGWEAKNVNSITLPENSSITGKLTAVSSFHVKDKKSSQLKEVPTYEITTSTGKVTIAGAAMLASLMKDVKVGSTVKILRFSNKKNSDGNDLGDYKVFVK